MVASTHPLVDGCNEMPRQSSEDRHPKRCSNLFYSPKVYVRYSTAGVPLCSWLFRVSRAKYRSQINLSSPVPLSPDSLHGVYTDNVMF